MGNSKKACEKRCREYQRQIEEMKEALAKKETDKEGGKVSL